LGSCARAVFAVFGVALSVLAAVYGRPRELQRHPNSSPLRIVVKLLSDWMQGNVAPQCDVLIALQRVALNAQGIDDAVCTSEPKNRRQQSRRISPAAHNPTNPNRSIFDLDNYARAVHF
jgi:hypothetical protein